MTTESEAASDSSEHLRPKERVLVARRNCGKPSPANRRADGSLGSLSSVERSACRGADFRVLSADDLPERW